MISVTRIFLYTTLVIILLILLPVFLINVNYQLKKGFIEGVPRYPKATSWRVGNNLGDFFDNTPYNQVYFSYEGKYEDAFLYYDKYLKSKGFVKLPGDKYSQQEREYMGNKSISYRTIYSLVILGVSIHNIYVVDHTSYSDKNGVTNNSFGIHF